MGINSGVKTIKDFRGNLSFFESLQIGEIKFKKICIHNISNYASSKDICEKLKQFNFFILLNFKIEYIESCSFKKKIMTDNCLYSIQKLVIHDVKLICENDNPLLLEIE